MNIFKVFSLKRLGFVVKAQNTIVSAAFVLAASTGVAAILGLIKARLLTANFGVSDELGVFYTADRIPTLVYSILVVGALSTVFIPIFTDLIQKDKEEAWKAASSIISIGMAAYVVMSLLVVIFAEPIINLISLGNFTDTEVHLGANLMRIMIVGQLILVFSSFLTSVLQSFRYFLFPALAPIVYNLGMILGIIFLTDRFGIYAPAIGVVIGALLHILIQAPSLFKVEFQYTPSFDLKNANVRKMFSLMPPRVTSVVFNQIVGTINNSLAILISTSSVVILKFAGQLQFFPVSLFGASMAAASLPVLSEHAKSTNKNGFKSIFLTTLHQMLFLVMPASAILIILRVPVVRLVYGVSNFTWEDTVKTSYTLAFFALSIFAQSVILLTTRAFYAWRDTLTPVKVAVVTIVLNVTLSLFFVEYLGLGVWSIAFSYSITAFIDMIVLMYLLSKKLGGFDPRALMAPFIKISYATVFMGISLYIPLKMLDQVVFDTTRTINLLMLTGIATTAGIASYLFFTWLFKVEEIELFYKLVRRLKVREPVQTSPAAVISEPKEGI